MQLFGRLNDLLQAQSTRLRNWGFLQAAMAAAALAACPEGRVSLARRVALDNLLNSLDELKAFEVHEAINLFNSHADQLRDEPEQGRVRALRAIRSVAEDREVSSLIIQIFSTISEAEGGYSVRDATQLRQVSKALGLPTPNTGVEDLRNVPTAQSAAPDRAGPRVIVLGNTKGGTGKSTIAAHLAVALLKMGFKVGAIDLDAEQGTLSRYFQNRVASREAGDGGLAMPVILCLESAGAGGRDTADAEDGARLREAFAELADCDYVLLDTPGSASHISRLGHFNADMLITPLNDSLIDIDVLARIDQAKREVLAPSDYCHMIRELRDQRRDKALGEIDWIVVRNRLAQLDTRNSRDVTQLLNQLSERIGFRLGHGLSERVVFRALFDRGLTLLDLPDDDPRITSTRSHYRACQEIFDLVAALGVTTAQPDRLAAQG